VQITVVVRDGLATASASFQVTVSNVAPTATFSHSGNAPVGSPITFTFLNPSDPSGPDTSAGFKYYFDFNNDGDFTDPGETLDPASNLVPTNPSVAFTFSTSGQKWVHGRIVDKDGGFTDFWFSVFVQPL
jgi:hypothetical protein